jgi:wyosine [tRNA(Phe)-imidazoG37] synthetase (radical SAM superfamily)
VSSEPARYVFGPVPSRRLGRSLGIDPIPLKTCNWNCVYCQLGRTRPFVTCRGRYSSPDVLLREVEVALNRWGDDDIDWITFVGSGEPLLHREFGSLLSGVKQLTRIPVAVLTNGALLRLPEVRAEMLTADAVLPSVDAGSPELYRRINRPHPSLDFEGFIEGLVSFRDEFSGRLWVEVMLIEGLNDDPAALADLARVLDRIHPDAVHVNAPVRPPAEVWVRPPSAERLAEAVALFGRAAGAVPPQMETETVSASSPGELGFELADRIAAVITRHPLAEADLALLFGDKTADEIRIALDTLVSQGRAQPVTRFGVRFYGPGGTHYAAVPRRSS